MAIFSQIEHISHKYPMKVKFCDRRRRACFRDGRHNERRTHFCDKRRHAPRNTCLLYLHNQRCAIGIHVSLLSQKRVRLRYKINSFLPSTEPVPLLDDTGTSHFFRSEMIAFACVSYLCLRFEFLTQCSSIQKIRNQGQTHMM
jgi:hypothetical protein